MFSATVSADNKAMSERLAKQFATTASTDRLAKQLTQQLEASLKVMNEPKLIKANAKYIRSLYNALVEEGFSKEQSIRIVSATLSGKK